MIVLNGVVGEEEATVTMPAGARVFWFVRRTVRMGWCEGCVWASRELCTGWRGGACVLLR